MAISTICELMEVSRQTIYDWENDKSAPSAKNIKKLAEVLKVDVSSFYKENLTHELNDDDKQTLEKEVINSRIMAVYEENIRDLRNTIKILEEEIAQYRARESGRGDHGKQ